MNESAATMRPDMPMIQVRTKGPLPFDVPVIFPNNSAITWFADIPQFKATP
jgi:hypothetical protein